jgi:hypothetical protein
MRRNYIALASVILVLLACQTLVPTPAPPANPTETTPIEVIPPTEPTLEEPTDPLAGSTGMGDSLYPSFGNGGYDSKTYTLDITVNNVA